MAFNVTQPTQVVISTAPAEIDRTGGSSRGNFNRWGRASNTKQRPSHDCEWGGAICNFGGWKRVIHRLCPNRTRHDARSDDYRDRVRRRGFPPPSESSVVFTVFSPVFVTMEQIGPIAVGDTMLISGSAKDNLEDGWLGSQTIEIFVDGVLVGITSSQENGLWSLEWTIPESMDVGNHSISAISPEQGFYRQGMTESNFTVSYHTSISHQVEQTYVTRGGHWNFTGRLFESDTGFEQGLEGREVSVLLDGSQVELVVTGEGGFFSYSHRVQYALSRGSHNVSFTFAGEFLYLPTEAVSQVFALSDIVVEVQPITNTIIRGDASPSSSIMIQGLVREVGGESAIFANLSMSLTWGESNLPISSGPWENPSTMNFQIRAKAQEFMHPGENIITIVVDSDQSRFLNGVSEEVEILVMIEVDFEYSELDLSNGQRVIRGTVNATARDTGAPLEGLSLTASLVNGSTTHFSVSKLTGEDGVFQYEFKSMAPLPALSEQSLPPEGWGLPGSADFLGLRFHRSREPGSSAPIRRVH